LTPWALLHYHCQENLGFLRHRLGGQSTEIGAYQEVASVLQMVRDAGFERVGLATEKRKPD
jgi:hypothetical protein